MSVRAVPANAELETVLAKSAGVATTPVSVASGATSRIKTVDIVGDPDTITARLLG